MNYKVAYEYKSVRIAKVKANSKEEAERNFNEGINIIEDVEDDSEDAKIIEITEK